MGEETVTYEVGLEKFDSGVFPYLDGMKELTIVNEGRYNQSIRLKRGIVHILSSPAGVRDKTDGKIIIITVECPEEVNKRLEELAKEN